MLSYGLLYTDVPVLADQQTLASALHRHRMPPRTTV